MHLRPGFQFLARLLLTAVGTWLLCRVGDALALRGASPVSPLWPASGLGVAAVALWGWPAAWGISLATAASNALSGMPGLFVAAGLVGNTAEAALGAWLILRVHRIGTGLGTVRDVLRFIATVPWLAALPSMGLGMAVLWYCGLVPGAAVPQAALLYWVANASGILILTPPLLLLGWRRRSTEPRRPWTLVFPALSALTAGAAFSGLLDPFLLVHTTAYLPFPFVVLAALYLGIRGATWTAAMVALTACLCTGYDLGPFAGAPLLEAFAQLVLYNASLATTALIFAAANAERLQAARLLAENAVREMELRQLRRQLHPHFLFNCLNSIRALVSEDPTRARGAVTGLATLLRQTLRAANDEAVPFEQELRLAEGYLELERLRFEDRLNFHIQAEPETLRRPFPPLVLLTLCENAIKHGVARQADRAEVRVESLLEQGRWVVRVLNPGRLDATPDPEGGLGLENTRQRLRLLYGEAATLELRETPAGVEARLDLGAALAKSIHP